MSVFFGHSWILMPPQGRGGRIPQSPGSRQGLEKGPELLRTSGVGTGDLEPGRIMGISACQSQERWGAASPAPTQCTVSTDLAWT